MDRLATRLQDNGYRVLVLREPGATALGNYLRKWLKTAESMTTEAEMYLFAAARAELVHEMIIPALEQGKIVVTDRYADSTVAYQGYGRGMDIGHIKEVNRIATNGVIPSLTFLLDCDPNIGFARIAEVAGGSTVDPINVSRQGEGERFESEPLQFHHDVRAGFLKIAAEDQARWVVINGELSLDDIATKIWSEVQQKVGRMQ